MAAVAAQAGCPIILMHNRHNRNYQDLISDMTEDLTASINLALTAGVEPQNIILDPGIGFAKDYTENLQAMMGLDVLGSLGIRCCWPLRAKIHPYRTRSAGG